MASQQRPGVVPSNEALMEHNRAHHEQMQKVHLQTLRPAGAGGASPTTHAGGTDAMGSMDGNATTEPLDLSDPALAHNRAVSARIAEIDVMFRYILPKFKAQRQHEAEKRRRESIRIAIEGPPVPT
jgi:hypothetical protein